eukprot:87940-Chlamydomonas_euryale.AAC.3
MCGYFSGRSGTSAMSRSVVRCKPWTEPVLACCEEARVYPHADARAPRPPPPATLSSGMPCSMYTPDEAVSDALVCGHREKTPLPHSSTPPHPPSTTLVLRRPAACAPQPRQLATLSCRYSDAMCGSNPISEPLMGSDAGTYGHAGPPPAATATAGRAPPPLAATPTTDGWPARP